MTKKIDDDGKEAKLLEAARAYCKAWVELATQDELDAVIAIYEGRKLPEKFLKKLKRPTLAVDNTGSKK